MKNLPKNTRGFTLIELLVVIVIIGILAVTIVPQIMGAPAKARDTGRVASLRTISSALQMYYFDNGQFPDASPSSGECIDADSGAGLALVSGGYLQRSSFPTDPTSSSTTGGLCTGSGDQGKFFYKALTNFGISNNSFLLVADTESDAQGNIASSSINSIASAEQASSDLSSYNGTSATGINEVYMLLGES